MKKNEKLKIVFEDKHLLIVSKKAKLLTISTEKEKEKTLYHQVYLYLKKKNQKVYIVHRLDYDTSGLVIFAKTPKVKQLLQNNWEKVTRRYMAIVKGNFKDKTGVIKSYLKTTKTNFVYSTNDSKNGLLAITNYQVVLDNLNYALVDILIKTGRKNQIRVHLADIGHPIIGDSKYNLDKNCFKRMYLHAYCLEFRHPITNELLKFEQDVPISFLDIIDLM